MFTDEQFETMKGFVEKNNPSLILDPEATKGKLADFDADLEKYLDGMRDENDDPLQFAAAAHITLQGRNFLARLIGEPEIPVPNDLTRRIEGHEPETEISKKHVALYVVEETHERALTKVLGLSINPGDYVVYHDTRELAREISYGHICGVVAFQVSSTNRIEGSIRHALKSLPGWDLESADAAALPPCLDVPLSQMGLGEAAIKQMKAGTYQKPDGKEAFVLSENLSVLAARMKVPKLPVKVVIIDDEPKKITGMALILQAWPMVTVELVIQTSNKEPELPYGDIFLLDEAMGQVTGTAIAQRIKGIDQSKVIASTTSGSKPAWANYHFSTKGDVEGDYQIAESFVNFFNQLLTALNNK
jgi:hypothetical protein